jgi:hypothetical protein
MTCISLDPVFDLAIYVTQVCPPLIPTQNSTQSLRSRPWKVRQQSQNALVRIIHIEQMSESLGELAFFFAKFIKPLDRRLIKEQMIS